MKLKRFIEKFRENFYKRVGNKSWTGWNNIELREEFEQAIIEALLDEAEEALFLQTHKGE